MSEGNGERPLPTPGDQDSDVKVLCIGSFFTRNFGDRAIYRAIRERLERDLGADVGRFPIKPLHVTHAPRDLSLLHKLVRGITWLPSHYLRLWRHSRASDVVVIGGGQLIHDLLPLTVVQFFLTCLTIRLARRRFLVGAVGVGPLDRRWSRLLVGTACSLSSGVIVRDSESFELMDSCPFSSRFLESEIVPDPALALTHSRWSAPQDGARIGISTLFYLKPEEYPGGSEARYTEYLDRLAALVSRFETRSTDDVILFSTVPWEDGETVRSLANRCTDSHRVQRVAVHSVEEALDLTASLSLQVGTRLHSLLFSLGQGIPAVALANHPRIVGLYRDLNAADLLFDIDDFDPAEVVAACESLRGRRGEQLLARVRDMQREAERGLGGIARRVAALGATESERTPSLPRSTVLAPPQAEPAHVSRPERGDPGTEAPEESGVWSDPAGEDLPVRSSH